MVPPVVVYSDTYEKLDYGPAHPLQPERFKKTLAIIKEKVPEVSIERPEDFTPEVLRKGHSSDYIERVKEAGRTGLDLSIDTPAFPEIFEWAFASVKGTLTAGKRILNNENVAFNPCGGWHHAERNSDGGFCVFNDVAILAEFLTELRKQPLIIDIDAHAGDGTMHILEEKPILKVSIHQDPSMFYPGDGFWDQVGTEEGLGFTVNVPLPTGSDDGCLLYVFDNLVEEMLEFYDFDVIIFQSGVDGHIDDTLSDLRYTGRGYLEVAKKLSTLDKPIVMLGGGGYNEETSAKLHTGILLGLIEKEERAKEIVNEADGFSEIITEESCLEMTKEIVKNIRERHPFFEERK